MGIDVEEAANAIRRGSRALSMDALAQACGVDVTRADADTLTEAETWPLRGRWQIRIHRAVPRPRARWLVGHELAEWWLASRGQIHAPLTPRFQFGTMVPHD